MTGATIVCEDPRLSMPCMGKEFQAIDLKRCNRDVPKIDTDELNFVLDLAAAALDVETSEAKTPSERKIKRAFLESEGFKRLVTPSPAPSPELPLSLFPMDLLGLGTVEVVVKDCTGMAPRLHFISVSSSTYVLLP